MINFFKNKNLNIIIAGAGKVGYRLATTLSINQNVYIIDKNKKALDNLAETIDIMPIIGDIEDPDTYEIFKDKQIDIFIAVTDSDEVNILSTLITDDILNIKEKIVRLKNPYFAKSSITNKLNIKKAVFPYLFTAKSINALLNFPKLNNIKKIPFSNFKLISIKANNTISKKFSDLNQKDLLVVGYERDKKLNFSTNNYIQQNDLIYIFTKEENINKICNILDSSESLNPKNIVIFGANILAIEIAKLLLTKNFNIKIIDKDLSLCQKASSILQDQVIIINSKYNEHSILEEENLNLADIAIFTDKDEQNIIKSITAKDFGIKKCIAINNDIEYYDLMHKLDLVTIRGPKINAYYSILESIDSNSVINEKHYCGGRGSILVRKIYKNSKLINKKIKPFKNKDVISIILRDDKIINLDNKIKENDLLITFSKTIYEDEIKNWIFNL